MDIENWLDEYFKTLQEFARPWIIRNGETRTHDTLVPNQVP